MIKGIIFDADGTLFDSMPLWENLGAKFLKTLGIAAKPDLDIALLKMSMKEGAQYLIDEYGVNLTKDEIMSRVSQIVAHDYAKKVKYKKGAEIFLKKLYEKNIPAVIATSNNEKLIRLALENAGAEKYIKKIFSCCNFSSGKTDSGVFKAAAEFLDANPNEVFVFDDGLFALETASKSGFKTVGIYDDSNKSETQKIKKVCDIYIEDFCDFDGFLKEAENV